MGAKYIVRLDDACPSFSLNKWERFFDIFDKYGIKPVIAVIPANRDSILYKENRSESVFWSMVKSWEQRGWCIALHGFDHVYINNESGINKITSHSEFVGLPLEHQIKKIALGLKIFENNGLRKPDVFVAPSHSLDYNTLLALKANQITTVSDGLYTHPYRFKGLKWVPCQLWWPQKKNKGVWTICYHPETATDTAVIQLEQFLVKHQSEFISIENTVESSVTLKDYLFRGIFFIKRNKIINSIASILRRLNIIDL